MKTHTWLVLIGGLAVLFGVLRSGTATDGVALVGAGCYLAIVARMAQASRHRAPPT